MYIWHFNLRHLRAAAAIGRLGSINAAAEDVSLTQPAVTQALARLESQIGLLLFERRHDGVVPTPAAKQFLPRVEAALAHIASKRVTMAQLKALTAFATAGSYPGAAQVTGLSQPSLHRAINDLSVALRRPLLERRGKGLTLTEAGRKTVRSFRLAKAELDAGVSELDGLKGQESGIITIGAMPLSRARLLPKAITLFLQTHADVRVKVVEGAWSELIEPLRDGDIDMMIGALRDPAPGEDVKQIPMFDDVPLVIARSGHPLAGNSPTLTDMARFPWIISAPGTPLRQQWQLMFSGLPDLPDIPVECGSVIAIRELLLGGNALTLLSPDQVRVELECGWLATICAAPNGMKRTIGTTTRTGWRPTPQQAAFLAYLKAAVPD